MKAMTVLKFADLKSKTMVFPIESPDGEKFDLPIKSITETELDAINSSVPEPVAPTKPVFKGKNVGYVDEPDIENPEYVKKKREAGREQTYRLLATCMMIDIPGDTVEEKAKALRENGVQSWILMTALDLINKSLGVDAAEVRKRKEQFQSS
jgi:hypothetical protein